jgi:pSer/pThr/pTyr-binding forkhead associated (FHA) protein/ribosomal protein L12E/L44/L45/RPP1/RPP2
LKPSPRFVFLNNPNAPAYKIEGSDLMIGRSPKKCQFAIPGDNTVSRVHARLTFKEGRYIIKNLGQNPTLVNKKPVDEKALRDGDTVSMGKTVLQFQVGAEIEVPDADSMEPGDAEKTIFMEGPPVSAKMWPRLMLDDGSSPIQSFPLEKTEFVIGRSSDSDLCIEDSSVSRSHCAIVRRNGDYYARNLSATYPLLVNDAKVEEAEKRLYSGDRIHVGSNVLTFLSDRPEDVAPAGEKEIVTQMKGAGWAVWATAAILLLVVAGYSFYTYVYVPRQEKNMMAAVSDLVESGETEKAREELIRILQGELSPEAEKTAQELLSKTTMELAGQMENRGALEEAQAFLRRHLRSYGAWEESNPLWARLDALYLNMGRYLESQEKYQMALNEYAAIGEDSIYFESAQKRMKAIWMEFQKQKLQDKNIAELLERGERSFLEKKYLTPADQNAYSAYRAVLEVDPQNRLALQRIEQMKEFYRFHGDKHLKAGNLSRALTFFERYSVIDPDDPDIEEKIKTVRNRLKTARVAKAPPKKTAKKEKPKEQKAASVPQDDSAGKQEVEKLLEGSGKENSWIMKYLFEDQQGEQESETPWE